MYISGGSDSLSCKLFPSTLRGVAIHWLATLLARTIRSFSDLTILFFSQFVVNKIKRLKANKGGKLEKLLGQVQQHHRLSRQPEPKKRLRVGQFSDALVLRRPTSMGEIRAQAEKHIEADEDLANRLEAECQLVALQEMKPGTSRGSKEETRYQIQSRSRDSNP
ncbi:hypothetical protein CR513_29741, partial [Mucuna pruriens]